MDFTRELLQNRKVSRPTLDAATARFGPRGTYDLEAPAHPTEKALTT